MQPSKGRIVMAVGGRATSNGDDTCPAMITRVWSENPEKECWTVNATLFPDATDPRTVTSVQLFDDEQAARDSNSHASATALYWPPRV